MQMLVDSFLLFITPAAFDVTGIRVKRPLSLTAMLWFLDDKTQISPRICAQMAQMQAFMNTQCVKTVMLCVQNACQITCAASLSSGFVIYSMFTSFAL